MRIYPEQLEARLQQRIEQTYLLFGSDPLLKLEAYECIKQHAKQHGFTETHNFVVDAQLNWQEVYDCTQNLSLFASKQILEFSLPESISTSLANQLKTLASWLQPDLIFIFRGPKITQKQETTAWFSSIKQQGLYVACNTPERNQMPQWIKRRCARLALSFDEESVSLLALWHEGNLLALSQSLLKMQLLYPDGKITLPRLHEALSTHHHFTPFQLTDALLEQKPKRAMRIIKQQQAEGVEILLLVRIVQKEVIQLYKMQEQLNSGIALVKVFDSLRIWQQKRQLYANALQRLPSQSLLATLQLLAKVELIIKHEFSSDPWPCFIEACLKISGLSLTNPQ